MAKQPSDDIMTEPLMDKTLDNTTLATIELLEARLLRLEHIIYGPAGNPDAIPESSATSTMHDLERRFQGLVSRSRVYQDLLKIYNEHPSLFVSESQHAQSDSKTKQPPTQLDPAAVRAIVLASASQYHGTASALAAVTQDVPVPDPALSASLVATAPRARAIEAMQRAQTAEVAELRARSERVVRAWYEGRVLKYSKFVADAEGRVQDVEKTVLRAEAIRAEGEKV